MLRLWTLCRICENICQDLSHCSTQKQLSDAVTFCFSSSNGVICSRASSEKHGYDKGDDGPTRSAELLNRSINTWCSACSLNTARSTFRLVRLRCTDILVAGGMDEYGVLANAELFDSVSHTWSAAGRLATYWGFLQMINLPGCSDSWWR